MFELVRLAIALVGTLIAGYKDLKTSDIPDVLVFSMIGLGLLISGIDSILIGSIEPFLSSLSIVIIFSAFALVMYYAGAWGGGDGALLVAIGALLPSAPFPNLPLPFPAIYFITVFIVGFLYSVAYLCAVVLRGAKLKNAYIKSLLHSKPLIYVFTALAAIPFALVQNFAAALLSVLLLSIPFIWQLAKISETAFLRRIPARLLKEGDMIGEDLPRLKIFKRRIRGLTAEEVRAIKKYKNFVLVRDGIRYGPVFFLALPPAIFSKEILYYFFL